MEITKAMTLFESPELFRTQDTEQSRANLIDDCKEISSLLMFSAEEIVLNSSLPEAQGESPSNLRRNIKVLIMTSLVMIINRTLTKETLNKINEKLEKDKINERLEKASVEGEATKLVNAYLNLQILLEDVFSMLVEETQVYKRNNFSKGETQVYLSLGVLRMLIKALTGESLDSPDKMLNGLNPEATTDELLEFIVNAALNGANNKLTEPHGKFFLKNAFKTFGTFVGYVYDELQQN